MVNFLNDLTWVLVKIASVLQSDIQNSAFINVQKRGQSKQYHLFFMVFMVRIDQMMFRFLQFFFFPSLQGHTTWISSSDVGL